MNKKTKYIAVEGPIGVGKSSLARRLAKTLGYQLVLEQPEENPFLQRYYESAGRYALQTQLSFLFARAEQMKRAKESVSSVAGRVADYMIEKDQLFAQLSLDDEEFYLYQQVHQNLEIVKPNIDLVIYLQAPVDVLLQRIARRKIDYEQELSVDYLQALNDAYTAFFHQYNYSPLLIVNASEINFVDNEQHYQMLLAHIEQTKAGRNFFNPLAEL